MTQTFTMDYLKSLSTYPFQDPRWKEKLLLVFMLLDYGAIFAMPFLGGWIESGAADDSSVFSIFPLISMVGFMGFFGIGMFFGVVLGVFFPAILGHVVAYDQFSAAVRVKEW